MRSATNLFRGRCLPTIYLDGVPLGPEDNPYIDDLVTGWSVTAIEVYPAMNKPGEFASMQGPPCGSIAIWTGGR